MLAFGPIALPAYNAGGRQGIYEHEQKASPFLYLESGLFSQAEIEMV